MGVTVREPSDPTTEAIAGAIRKYADAHSAAEADVYRYSPVSVRVRIIDPEFRGKTRSERHRTVWPLLYELDGDVLSELTMLLLLTPEEKDTSSANKEFLNESFIADLNRVLREIGTKAD